MSSVLHPSPDLSLDALAEPGPRRRYVRRRYSHDLRIDKTPKLGSLTVEPYLCPGCNRRVVYRPCVICEANAGTEPRSRLPDATEADLMPDVVTKGLIAAAALVAEGGAV